ncbi:class II poly(R)-hydroxyalkanoic acid synthase, partial [Pseudomonas aeruginosa]|nr:class II poly(R)-hydroxyalkanoic acid synthase [Pseudomonas aeruginosa]
ACYFENDKLSSDPRAWYYDAKREEGSWWPVWLGWLQERSGELGNPDFNLGSAAHPPLEAAPGTYVHIR